MKKYLEKLIHKSFVRNAATVVTGTAFAQAIIIAFSPILTRLYGPEAFGLLGTFMALVGILSPIVALNYPLAIVLPKYDEEAKRLTKLSLYISTCLVIGITIILLFGGDWLLNLIGAEAIGRYIFLIPLFVLVANWHLISHEWVIRKKLFRLKAKATITHAFLDSGAKSVTGLFYPYAVVLIIFSTIGQFILFSLYYIGFKRSNTKNATQNSGTPNNSLKEIAVRYKQFPMYQTPSMFLSTASTSVPILVLTAFFGPIAAGFYTLSLKVLKMPSVLIGKSVGIVFYQKLATVLNEGQKNDRLLLKTTSGLFLIASIPYIIIFIFGPFLFEFIFGSEWTMAGHYGRWMTLWMFASFMQQPSDKAMIIMKKQHLTFILEIIGMIFKIASLIIAIYLFNNDLYAVASYSIIGMFQSLTVILLAFYIDNRINRNF